MDLIELFGEYLPLLFAAVVGGYVSAVVALKIWRKNAQLTITQELLKECLSVQALKEAWILDGDNYVSLKLSENKNIQTKFNSNKPYLRKVEVRSVLDEAEWNAPGGPKEIEKQFYRLLDERRTWIVRDKVIEYEKHHNKKMINDRYLCPHPALISSKGMEELCGWINTVAWAHKNDILTGQGLKMIKYLLDPICRKDRIKVFGRRLTGDAIEFLNDNRKDSSA